MIGLEITSAGDVFMSNNGRFDSTLIKSLEEVKSKISLKIFFDYFSDTIVDLQKDISSMKEKVQDPLYIIGKYEELKMQSLMKHARLPFGRIF